jgi:hypothetical protein
MNREEYYEAKRLLDEISQELQTQPLTVEQRRELEIHAARLSGLLLAPWLPLSWTRRAIMAALFLIGLQQALVGNHAALLLWLLLPTFSPRMMGEAAHFVGRLRGGYRG